MSSSLKKLLHFSGSIHEPYLKIVKVLRSLEFKAAKEHPLLSIASDLQGLIGQQSHKLPNVFSFFKAEYQPAGKYLDMNCDLAILSEID